MTRAIIPAVFAFTLLASPVGAQVQLSTAPGPVRVAVVSYRDIPFRTVVRQQYDFSCGSAALATLLRYHYGRDVDEGMVFRAMYAAGDQDEIRRVGFSLLDMKTYLEAHGYRADGYRVRMADLDRRGPPAIVMINTGGYRHFVVLKGVEGDRVLIGDPALGLKVYSRAQFVRLWNGIIFLVHERAQTMNLASDWSPWAPAQPDRALPTGSLAELTRELPPLYQVTTTFSLNEVLR